MIKTMSDETNDKPLISFYSLIFGALLSIAFFLFMTYMLMPHVPSEDSTVVLFVAGMTSFCMTGVFLASHQYVYCDSC
jgi:hypothetical protein